MRVGPEDTLMGILPFFHIYGQVATLLYGLFAGSNIALMKKFEFPKFLDALEKHRVSESYPLLLTYPVNSSLIYAYLGVTLGMIKLLYLLNIMIMIF